MWVIKAKMRGEVQVFMALMGVNVLGNHCINGKQCAGYPGTDGKVQVHMAWMGAKV